MENKIPAILYLKEWFKAIHIINSEETDVISSHLCRSWRWRQRVRRLRIHGWSAHKYYGCTVVPLRQHRHHPHHLQLQKILGLAPHGLLLLRDHYNFGQLLPHSRLHRTHLSQRPTAIRILRRNTQSPLHSRHSVLWSSGSGESAWSCHKTDERMQLPVNIDIVDQEDPYLEWICGCMYCQG